MKTVYSRKSATVILVTKPRRIHTTAVTTSPHQNMFSSKPGSYLWRLPCSGMSQGECLLLLWKDSLLSETYLCVCVWVCVGVWEKGRLLGWSSDRQQTERQSAPAEPALLCSEHTTRTCSSADYTLLTQSRRSCFTHKFLCLTHSEFLA